MANTGKVDRGLSEADWNKRIDSLIQNLLKVKKKKKSAQDPSEVKTPKRKSLTPMVAKRKRK